jgi:hypothetical protein
MVDQVVLGCDFGGSIFGLSAADAVGFRTTVLIPRCCK